MIDWMTVVIRIPHRPINGGYIVACDRNGESEFKSDRKLPIRSSYDGTVMVRSSGSVTIDGWFTELWIDGNLSKWLYGHNISGHDDGPRLVDDFLTRASHLLDIEWHPGVCDIVSTNNLKGMEQRDLGRIPFWRRQIISGDFVCKRLDITYSYALDDNKTVSEYIEFLAATSRTKFSRAVMAGNSTVYYNKNSTHWGFKIYNKLQELSSRKKSHRLPFDQPVTEALKQIAEPLLRCELVLRSRKLKEIAEKYGYDDATWSALFDYRNLKTYDRQDTYQFTPAGLFQMFYDKIQTSDVPESIDDLARESLKRQEYGTLLAWRSGADVRSMLPRTTFYRHRTVILDRLGVDIAMIPDEVTRHQGKRSRVFRLIPADQTRLFQQVQSAIAQAA